MNNAGGALNFNAVLNLNEWRRNVDQMRRDIAGLNQKTQQNTRQMDNAFRNLSVGVASYFSVHVVKDFIMELINVRGEFQQMENAIETITGSTQVMNGLMDEWKELTLRSPFRLSEIGQAGKQLLAYGIDVNKVTHDIEMLGNVAAGVSAPIGDIAYVYGTLKTQGRAYTRDILQFTMRGIPIMGELAKVMGVNVSELKGLIEAGKVGFPEVEKAMNNLTSEGGKFNNLIGKQATTLTGSLNRMKHEFELMLNEIGTANEGILKGGIDAITHLIENYKEVGRVLLTLIEIYGIYRTALLVTAAIQKASIAIDAIKAWISLARSIRTAADAQALFNLTANANPYVLIITAIGALVAITYNYREELGELLGIIDDTTNAQRAQEEVMAEYHLNFSKGVYQTKASISELVNTIKNESSTLEMRKTAYEKLIKIDETFRGALDAQYRATTKLGEAMVFVTQKIDAFAMAQAKASASRKLLEQSFEAQFERDAVKVQIDNAKAEAKKWRDLDVEARKQGKANLEYLRNAVKYDQEAAKLEKELVEKRKIANQKTGVSNTIIRENNKQVNDATKNLEKTKKQIAEYKKLGKDVGQLEKNREKLENFLNGFKPIDMTPEEETKAKEGWAARIKAQIDELESQLDSAPNQAAYMKIKDKIKQLNDLLNPKQTKEKQYAEIIPEDSIKALQRNAQLLSDAIDVASKGMVKLRKLDKYGNDKDKKGNPFLTGKIISIEEAGKRLEEINGEINKRQYKNFDEQLAESEKQWKAKYQIAQYYGEKIANEEFPDLKGSYYDDILQKFQVLDNKRNEGVSLTDSEINQWQKLKDILSSLTGQKDPLSNFNDSIDKALQKLPSLYDQIEYLENLRDSQDNTGTSQGFYAAADSKLQEKIQEQKNIYQQFINEQETFEQKQVSIAQKYNGIRKEIGKNKTLSDPERLRLLDAAGKAEAKEYRDAFVSVMEKTDLFEKVFGNIDALTKKEISTFIPQLESKINDLINLGAPAQEVEKFREKLEKLKDLSKDSGPVKKLIDSFKELRKKIREGTATQEDFNRLNQHLQETKFYTDLAVNSAKELAEALSIDGKGGPFEKFAKDLTQTLEGLVNALVGYFSGNIQQMVGGIAQMVVGIVKMLSTAGDGRKEKGIRAWKRAVDELKASYEELQRVIEKTAGEGQLSMQRQLIANLKEQQRILIEMRSKESEKKKSDQDKIASFTQQINDINIQIQDLIDNFQKSITTTDFKELSEKISEALIEAFGKGEDAAKSFEKIVDDVMRNAVANALRIKILEPAVQQMVDSLYSSMGFGGESGATSQQATLLKSYEDQIKEIDEKLKTASSTQAYDLNKIKNSLLEKIKILQQQIAANVVSGSFDGLTQEERDKIKAMGTTAMQQYMAALEQYKELFGESAENAQGLKGDIKGITEKTAGALEGQINAMRINVAEALKIHRENQNVFKNQLLQLTQIEINTRPLKGIYDQIKELNSKVKNNLAGVP
ncbi:tape measure protein [Chryseobacterium sp. MHB01]|uniref:tape measure protein n=1 Tax=Chryseobacterium sp. MHB01 TaxID=3109433 RepID=UPI002AFFFE32|nr:tape measure protein [Chryseobacterium sp. MHB01]MEA1849196.1 tape measure protein [Chryseobacterium sp. MHB01]